MIVSSLFSSFPPFWWVYCVIATFGRDLFGSEVTCPAMSVPHDGTDRPWDTWGNEIRDALASVSGPSVVCCGRGPLALWMYLGRVLWNGKTTEHVVVNFPKGASEGQAFFLSGAMTGEEAPHDAFMTLTPPVDADVSAGGAAMLYVSVTPTLTFSPRHEEQVRGLFPNDEVKFWRLHPTAERITVDASNLRRCVAHIRDALEHIGGSGHAETLVLATSAVDAVAFAMGALANVHKFRRIVFLELVNGAYQPAFE
jgi:hypothetical protein